MVDELNRLLEDLHDLQTYWSTESKMREDESGKMYAELLIVCLYEKESLPA
ncbi:hypothetical protein [Paenibacillus elgii]|uniref:hypothetical protein n=1 Tax=Paenibacillus elgii TaxID=189691 RepID=UPI00204268D9|nr:hypothetical protein [Paenibacillus elgii]